jgi:hypothetical protein
MSDDTSGIERALGRVEGKLDAMMVHLVDEVKAQDLRITAVERKVWWGAGIAASLTFIAGKLALPSFH